MPVKDRSAQELKGFLGVNLRRERLDLEDEELAKAINADLHLQPGSIVLRRGRSQQNTTPLADQSIRRLAKINSIRYRIAGQSAYRESERILTDELSPNLFTTLQAFRPLNDSTTWAFIADDAIMRKDNGTTVAQWGIEAPTVTPTVTSGPGTLNGDYSTVYTYVRKTDDGKIAHESNASPASATLSLTNGKLVVEDLDLLRPTDPQVTHLRFYRTFADGTQYLFETEVAVASIPVAVDPSDPVDTTGYEYGYTQDFELALLPQTSTKYTSDFERPLAWVLSSRVDRCTQTDATYQVMFAWELEHLAGSPVVSTGETVQTDAISAPLSNRFTILQSNYGVCYQWEAELVKASASDPASLPAQAASVLVVVLGLSDDALGTALELDNDPPPLASWVSEFQGHALLTRDAENPHYLWFSKRFRPESVPADNFLEIGNPDDPLQCAVPLGGQVGVFSRQTKYRMLGNATSGFVATEAISRRGTAAAAATIATEFAIIFLSREGVFRTTLLSADEELSGHIAPIFWGETVNGIGAVTPTAIHRSSAAYWQGVYYLSLPTGGSASPNLMACFSRDTQRWYFFDHPARSLFVEEDIDQLTAGFGDGFVYVLESGSTDAGTMIALDCETADRSGQVDTLRKLFLWLRVDADTQGAPLNVDLYVDGALKRTATISGSRTKSLIPFPEGCLGYAWRAAFRYTGTARVRVYGCSAIWLPMEVA